VCIALVAVAGFLLGLRAGIEIGYRRAEKRWTDLASPKSSGRILPG
jgi:hypothetical protein